MRRAQFLRARTSGLSPCVRCSSIQVAGSVFCQVHAGEYAAILARAAAGEVTFPEAVSFCERVYWPEGA